MKRILSWMVCLALILSMVPAIGSVAGAAEYTVVDKIPATLDTSTSYSPWGATYGGGWVPMMGTESGQPDGGAFLAWADTHYAEVVAEGNQDAGALHIKSGASTIAVGINIGMTPGETYTIGMWVKGSTTNPNRVLSLYGNGDGTIIGAAEYSAGGVVASTTISDQWTYVERSFTANLNQLNLWAANWGENDIYIDNITVKNSAGADLMAGYGDFYTYGEVVKDSEITNELTENGCLDAAKSASAYNASEKVWVPMYPSGTPADSWPAWDADHYAEIVANGYADAGSLHIVSAAGKNTGLAINAGMTVGQTYTLSLWAKGTAQSQTLFSYANGNSVIIETAEALTSQWKQFTVTFTAELSQLNLCCRDWGSNDVYVDNITLTDANGNELLGCAGSFCHKAVVDSAVAATCTTAGLTQGTHCSACNEILVAQTEIAALGHSFGTSGSDGRSYCASCGVAKQWPDAEMLDVSKLSDDWAGAPVGQWVPFTPWANYQDTWPAWENSVNCGEIAEEGHKDAGSLHLVSAIQRNTGVVINPGLVSGETYTLGLWAKGTSNSGKVLAVYGHGDPVVIGASAELGEDWTYYEISFTANRPGFALFASDWGVTDLYIDNITLKNTAGTDMLAGYGDFYTEIDPSLVVTAITLDSTKLDDLYEAPSDEWVPFTPWENYQESWPVWDADHYAEIVSEGNKDAGALHLVSAAGKNTGVVINPGMTVGETYTIGMWVKGTTSNPNRTLVIYGNGDGSIIGATEYSADGVVAATSVNAQWTYVERPFTATHTCLAIFAADWGVNDLYIDNITLKDAAGTDLLAGYGNFCKIEQDEPEEPTEPEVEGLAVISSEMERAFRWYWNNMTYPETDYSKVNISGYGADDPGSLHFWQSTTGSADVNLALATSLASDLPSGSYTLSLNVKGTFSNTTETFTVYPAYCNDDQMRALSIPKKLQEVTGVTPNASGMYVVDEWTNLTWELPASPEDGENGFMFLALMFSKYNNTCEYYIDNIQIFDPEGNDVLGGAGSFMDSGSQYWPIILPSTGAEILNSNTMYYAVNGGTSSVSISNHEESGITLGDKNFSVTHNDVTQTASNKNVTMQMAPKSEGEPIVFAITSTAGSVEIPENILEAVSRAEEFNIYDIVITPVGCSHSYGDWNVATAPTYTTVGEQSKTCSLCGDVVTEEIPVLANPVTGWNITLKDNIGVNFVMTLAETDVVTATVNGNAVDCTVTEGKFSIEVAAAQMMDEIAISVNGLSLANTYSVRKYADVVLADSTKSDCHELVKNMLVYGGAAQTYFGYNAENLASSGITVEADVPTGDAGVEISDNIGVLSFYGATLVHKSKIAVRFYFTGSTEGLSFTVSGENVDVSEKNGMYYVEIAGINPPDLGNNVTVVVTDGTDSLSVSYSPLDYMIRMYNKVDSTDATKAVVQALYSYYQAAIAYTA